MMPDKIIVLDDHTNALSLFASIFYGIMINGASLYREALFISLII